MSELLKRIVKEKVRLVKEGVLKKQDSLSEIGEEKKPFELQKGWEFCTLGDIAINVDYGTSEKADLTSEVPVLRMGNVQDGKIILDNLKYVSRTISDLPRLFLKEKDLIFNRTNSFELVGKCGIFEGADDQFTLASYLIRVSVLKEFVSIDFINFYINSIICRTTQIEPQVTQQTGQANFSGSKLKNIVLPLSPFAEQQRIVSKINELFALCDSLKEKIQKSQELQVLLSKTIVEKAVQ
jgi:type I restriction enzyme, S subunit